MAQLQAMAEQLKRLTLLHNEKADKYETENHPLCTRIRRRTWEGEDITFSKYDGINDPRMHITIFEEAACCHLYDEDMLARLFQLSLGEEASEWFYELKDQSITSYRQLKQEFLDQYQHSIKKKPTIMDLARMR